MSLTKFLEVPDVKARITRLRPKMPRKIGVPLKVEPRSSRYPLVVTAFDYLLRFELQRQAPHAVPKRWVAEAAPKLLDSLDVFAGIAPSLYMPPEEVAKHASRILADAKAAVAIYVKEKVPSKTRQNDLAAHAIRLAKLDSVYRAKRLEPTFEEATSEDIEDLIEMLKVVPFDKLLHPKLMYLNPVFGETSRLVGGADTDLIAGDFLVDFKTTKEGETKACDLDQLLGYLFLARRQRSVDPAFPAINRLGLYYCRHGYLWSVDTSFWSSQSEFPEIETWFFQRASEFVAARKASTHQD